MDDLENEPDKPRTFKKGTHLAVVLEDFWKLIQRVVSSATIVYSIRRCSLIKTSHNGDCNGVLDRDHLS
jgi:hypothetical protein